MQKKWIFFAGILLLLMAGGWSYYLYQKPRAGVQGARAVYTLSAEKLFAAFAQNEQAANQTYTGKVVEVKGVVSEVQQANNTTSILLGAGGATGGINCSLAGPLISTVRPKKGAVVIVKGRCTGFLMDVNLVDGVLQP